MSAAQARAEDPPETRCKDTRVQVRIGGSSVLATD